jgi:hypothetical protein
LTDAQTDERTRRVAANEALFRTVNEKLEELNEGFALLTDTFDIVCECGEIDCDERIILSPEEYARLRSEPTRFAVVHGHEIAGVEDVIERHEAFAILAKAPGLATELAQETAP